MCGIVGIFCKRKGDYSHTIERMAKAIAHRGPDNSGKFIDSERGIYLYHQRLSIIDLSPNANQPILNEKKNKVLLANGEIYNYKELRRELQAKGHIFSSQTDAEVIIHAYEEYGNDFVSYLEGMFAFAIWDIQKQTLLIARDRIGIKPLYYINNEKFFAFSSEVKAFFEFDKTVWNKQIDEEKIENLVFFPYIPDNENTIFKEVKKVSPATIIFYQKEKFEIKRYWKLEVNPDYASLKFSQALEKCENLLKKAVKKRLQADVPVGILLSGGIDSSLICALANEYSQETQIFTARYEHKLDESCFARLTSASINKRYHEINIDIQKHIVGNIEKTIMCFDDLSTLDGGLFMNYLLSKKIREFGVKVVLLGDAADELFGGYSWYGMSQFPFNLAPLYLKTSIYYYALSRTFSSLKAFKYVNNLYKKFSLAKGDLFRRISNFELSFQLPNHFLSRADKATMAYGIEARIPYMDEDLVSFVYSLPRQFKFKGKIFNFKAVNEKFILREIAKRYLPKEIVRRKKYGFSIPMGEILTANKEKVRDYVLGADSPARKYFSKKEIFKMLNFKEKMYHPIDKEKEFLIWRLFLIAVYMHNIVKRQ